MGIESFLNSSDKREALNELKSMLAKEIYISCIMCSLDPDSFDYVEYLNSINDSTIPTVGSSWGNLLELCKKMSIIENKIASL
jgi:hypothetical protein